MRAREGEEALIANILLRSFIAFGVVKGDECGF